MNMKRVGFLVVAIKLLHVKTMYSLFGDSENSENNS